MTIHFVNQMAKLRKTILSEAALVEEAIGNAIRSFLESDEKLADSVIAGDSEVDQIEIDVEEECLKLLALYQPVADDLRYIVAVLKLNNDLERMGDIAVSIARRGRYLGRTGGRAVFADSMSSMADATRRMVRDSLDALVNGDTALAVRVCQSDDAVDALKREVSAKIRDEIRRDPENVELYIKVLAVPRHLERIADLATNIAEDVIYMVSGEIIRHRDQVENGAAID